MKVLTDDEIKLMDGLKITPNQLNGETDIYKDEDQPRPYPLLEKVLDFCLHNGITEVKDKVSAHIFLQKLEDKLTVEEDSCTLEDTAAWVLSHYFTKEQLEKMTAEEAETFLQDWKYWFGFRKCHGWGDTYIEMAIQVIDGDLIAKDCEGDLMYFPKDE